jgi:hypothetical protein
MLPAFTEHGVLPIGVHQATAEEVFTRFATSPARRQWLGERLRDVIATAKATGKLHRLILWGSFVTAKPAPNDLDLLLIMAADFDPAQEPEPLRVLFDYPQARIRFRADVFWTTVTMPAETLALWLDTYQIGKDFQRRGIVEVSIS